MSGEKLLEIRSAPYRRGRFLLAVGGLIYGIARLGEPQKIKTKSEWRNLLKLHHWDTPEIPYKRGIAYAFRI